VRGGAREEEGGGRRGEGGERACGTYDYVGME